MDNENKIILIRAGNVEAQAELNGSKTADAIWSALPIKASANTWGNEIYFSIPVILKNDDGKEVVDLGDLGYWPPGHAFCIFFGPTPASRGNEIRPASAVNVFGKLLGAPTIFRKVRDGASVTIEKVK